MEKLAYIILPILLFVSFRVSRRDKQQFEIFKTFDKSEDRQKLFKQWLNDSLFLHGILSLLYLLILGHITAVIKMPDFLVELAKPIQALGATKPGDPSSSSMIKGFMESIIPLLVIGTPLVTLAVVYLQHRQSKGNNTKEKVDNREINYLIPRNSKERFWTTLLSINAGFSEELFFRILVPILIYITTGSAILAIIASSIWFGLVHYYQGMMGIIVTTIIGALLFLIYLYSGNIWIVMLIHAILDINSLALAPWFKEYLNRSE